MGCTSCSKGGAPTGCGSKGHCLTGGCNKMNTFDWLSNLTLNDPSQFKLVEVSFKKGARKDFFRNENIVGLSTGDLILVDSESGYDTGVVSLSGELVRMQLRKKKIPKDRIFKKVIRVANERDREKLLYARSKEKETLVKARAIARMLDLNMKIGDIEYQGDGRKATFFYTAEGRVDFRELVRHYAKEFKVKIEMRQIGSRQESARIGGIGSCGRELCCSTWLSDFRSVSTAAARYQNISINQTKLSGQCGRLKCCLNYELNTYMDALEGFPKRVDILKTKKGNASLIKMDIFKGLMYYVYLDEKLRGPMMTISKDKVKEIKALNDKGQYPEDLKMYMDLGGYSKDGKEEDIVEYEDVTGEIELPSEKKQRSGKRKPKSKRPSRGPRSERKPRSGGSSKDEPKSSAPGGSHKKDDAGKPDSRKKKKRYFKKKTKKDNNKQD